MMVSRPVRGALAALAGAAMFVAASSSPSLAFTLSSPSLEQPVLSGRLLVQLGPLRRLGMASLGLLASSLGLAPMGWRLGLASMGWGLGLASWLASLGLMPRLNTEHAPGEPFGA
jgi:hypothetical protein